MAADFKVYGFCENKCLREVMLKEDIEKRFKNLENELPGLSGIESVKKQTSVNKSKLDALKDLGKVVHSRKESFSASGSNMQMYSNYLTYADLSSVLEDDADYMLVLSIDGEKSSPSILSVAGGFTDYRFTGHVIFNLYSGSKLIGSCQCTFTRGYGGSGNALGGFYIASLPIKKSDFANGRNLTLRCTPWILENTDGSVSLSSRTYTLNMYMDYKIIKVGYDLSVIEDEANLPEGGGTNDYNGLINKPSINGVTLEGELTAEDLGLGGGGTGGVSSLADLGVTASAKELNYMKDVTSPVQTQLNDKAEAVHSHAEYEAINIKETATGENIHLIDSVDGKAVEFALYGKATQEGEPTSENPVDIVVAGSSGSVNVISHGKNLLENKATTRIVDGVTFTINDDKSISLRGSATKDINFIINDNFKIPVGNYKSSVLNGNASIFMYAHRQNADDSWNYGITNSYSNPNLLLTDDYKKLVVGITIKNGTNVNNTVIKPMIRLASISDDTWEPYKGLINFTIQTPNGIAGIPVDSGGNYTDQSGQQWICDEIVKYANGSGKKIQRIGIIENYNSEAITGTYISTKGELSAGAKVIYQLSEPIATSLNSEQIAEIKKLSTFYPVTNITNDAGCGMKVLYPADSKNYVDKKVAEQYPTTKILYSDTEPSQVAENTVVMVYEV